MKLALVFLFIAVTLFGSEAPRVLETYCNLNWLHVKIRALTIDGWYTLSDEVFLGRGCPVTSVWQDFYKFLYPTSDCGIRYEVLKGKIVFRTVLSFVSKTLPKRGIMFVSCVVDQDKPSEPATTYIDPGQARWLASSVYKEFSMNFAECFKPHPKS